MEKSETDCAATDRDAPGRASGASGARPPSGTRKSTPPPSSRTFDLAHEVVGASPGTLHIFSDERPLMVLSDYGPKRHDERTLKDIDEVRDFIDAESITWIDIRGIGHRPTFERLGEIFKIHPLALEDMVNVPQRPKSEVYRDQQLIITRMVSIDDQGALSSEQFAILFGKGFVVTVQEERHTDCLDPVRRRIREARGTIRTRGSDYLAYALVDAVIDGFYPVLEHYGEALDELELRVLDSERSLSAEIFDMKRDLLQLRRAIWPQRDLLTMLIREDSQHISEDTRPYLRDSYDHAVQIMDMVETFREIASSLMDLMMTGVSNRLNEVMKVLTIVSTIFLPMTFVAGVYGMNFNTDASRWNMPELGWGYGYPFSIVLMLVSAGTLLLYYRHKGWIGPDPALRRARRRNKREAVQRRRA